MKSIQLMRGWEYDHILQMSEQAKHTCQLSADGRHAQLSAEISGINDHGHKQEELWAYRHPGRDGTSKDTNAL